MKKFLILCLSILFTSPLFASGIGANATFAPCDNATLETYGGTANVEINWEPNTINLRWYDGDTRLNVQNAAQTCTYDDTLTVPSQPTRTGYTFVGWELRMPGTYTELEYLESTGTQYIDTGITVKENTLAEFEYQYTSTAAVNYVFGQVAGYASKIMGYRSNRIWWFLGNYVDFLDSSKHSVEFSADNKVYRDGVYIAKRGTFVAPVQSATILLFAERNDNNVINKGKVKIFKFKLKEDKNLIQNLIPAQRNSDGVLGMWDSVTQTFFTNAGTGTFIAGPVVQ